MTETPTYTHTGRHIQICLQDADVGEKSTAKSLSSYFYTRMGKDSLDLQKKKYVLLL